MSLDIKKFKADITYHKVIDGIVEEIIIEKDIYRLVRPESEATAEDDGYQLKLIKPETKIVETNQEREKKESRRITGALELSETYRVWVTEKLVSKVKQAIQHVELNYVPTSETIRKQTGLSMSKCQATLQYLLRKNMIRFEKDEKHIVIYHIGGQQQQQKKEKGKRLGSMKDNPIYENVLNEVIVGMKEGKRYSELEKIIETYYPNCTKSTYHTYVNVYKRWHREYSSSLVLEKGKVLDRLGGNYIYENIFIAINQGRKEGMQAEGLKNIIKSYHPNAKPSSLYTYLKAYLRYKSKISTTNY